MVDCVYECKISLFDATGVVPAGVAELPAGKRLLRQRTVLSEEDAEGE